MMKLGLVSAILDNKNFEEVIDVVANYGMECVELACWPQGKAERRYAGVSHLDVDNLTNENIQKIKDYCVSKNVEISALGYYPNTLEEDKRGFHVTHLLKLIDAAKKLDVNMITTFIGRIPDKTVTENIKIAKEVWTPILKYAEEKNVKIAIENCPMLFTEDEWPGGKNLMTTPAIWRRVFEELDSPILGLNYDPSHFIWQQIDYIKPLYEFKDKIFHVHYCKRAHYFSLPFSH